MDADGLPIVGPGIDLTKVDSIHQKRTLAFLNHFITHTASFLNHFSRVCEEKLDGLSVRVQRLDTSMRILEAKLSSIPGLDDVTVPSGGRPEPVGGESTTTNVTTPQQPDSEPTVDSAPLPTQTAPETEATPHPEPEPEPQSNPVSQDPRYAKFFKMLKMGVPPPAIKLKMTSENVNPDFLDTPDAPAPPGGPPAAGTPQDSDDSLSDREESSSDDSSAGFSD